MLKKYWRHFSKTKSTQQITAIIVVLIVAGLGTYLLVGSHAASPYISATADSGTLTSGATQQTCSGSNNGSCVIFGSSTTTTPPSTGQKNCLQLQSGSSIYPIYADLDTCGYPSPDTAGVPSGTSLTTISSSNAPANTSWNASSGELSISGPTTINDLYIPGTIYISNFACPSGTCITIENSKIEAAPSGGLSTFDFQGENNVLIKYSQVSGIYSGSTCTTLGSYDMSDFGTGDVFDHDIFSCAIEPINGSHFTLTNSYVLVDGTTVPSDHVEDVFVPGGTGATIKDDTLLNPQTMANGSVAGIFGGTNVGGPMTGLSIEDNLFGDWGNNGAITIGCSPENGGSGNDINTVVTGNRLSSIYNPSGFAAGNTDGGSGITWSGNYMDNNPSTVVNEPVGGC
jgi:hypothetical protein